MKKYLNIDGKFMIYNFGKANILFLFYLWYNLDIMGLIYDIFFPILHLKQNSITAKQEEECNLWGDYCCVTFEKQIYCVSLSYAQSVQQQQGWYRKNTHTID